MFAWSVNFLLTFKYREDNMRGILCRVNHDNSKHTYNEFMPTAKTGSFPLIPLFDVTYTIYQL